MRRTTIALPDDLAWRLEHEAKRRETSVSGVIREVLAERFGMVPGRPREIPWAGLGGSGSTNTGERFEEILAQEWPADLERDRDRR